MKVNNISIFAGVDNGSIGRTNRHGLSGRQKQGGTVQGAFLNGQFDPIEQKRALAKKRAYKIVSDTYASERKLGDDLKAREERIKQHYKVMADANRELDKIDEDKEKLRKEYGVAEDSEEQKDLELLEKYNRYKRQNVAVSDLSYEELMRGKELEAQGYGKGYTEYQKRVLEMDSFKDTHLKNIQDSKQGIVEESAIIRATNLERLKKHPMLDAQKEADEILAAASDEIMGMLIDEAKDHVDEKAEEEQEKAEEHKEEKKEEQEKLDAAKERREEMEALVDPEKAKKEHRRTEETDVLAADPMTEGFLKMENIKSDIQQEVSDMMLKMKLVAEDIKGIKVDEVL